MKLYIVWHVYFTEDSKGHRKETKRRINTIFFSEEEALRVYKELRDKHCFDYEPQLEEFYTEDPPDLADVKNCIQYYSEI